MITACGDLLLSALHALTPSYDGKPSAACVSEREAWAARGATAHLNDPVLVRLLERLGAATDQNAIDALARQVEEAVDGEPDADARLDAFYQLSLERSPHVRRRRATLGS